MAKAKKRKAAKPAGAVEMKAAEKRCAHAFCDDACKAGTKPAVTEDDLPRRARRALADRTQAIDALRQLTVGRLVDLERRAGVVVGRPEQGAGEDLYDGFPRSVRRSPGTRGRSTRTCRTEIVVAGRTVRCGAEALPGRPGCEEHSAGAGENPGQLPPPPQADPSGELAAALADGEVVETDGAPAAVRRAYRELDAAIDRLLAALGLVDVLLRNPLAGRAPAVGSCRACGAMVTGVGSDRFRGGYCPRCDAAWRRRVNESDGPVDRVVFERERRERRESAA